jgi:hypothetical protein
MQLFFYPDVHSVARLALEQAQFLSVANDWPWDPFNCSILIKALDNEKAK